MGLFDIFKPKPSGRRSWRAVSFEPLRRGSRAYGSATALRAPRSIQPDSVPHRLIHHGSSMLDEAALDDARAARYGGYFAAAEVGR